MAWSGESGDRGDFARFGDEPLTLALIDEAMIGITSPLSVSKLFTFAQYAMYILWVPFIALFIDEGDEPVDSADFIGGWPWWAFYMEMCLIIWALINVVMTGLWTETEAAKNSEVRSATPCHAILYLRLNAYTNFI
jgi:hypothetical protein